MGLSATLFSPFVSRSRTEPLAFAPSVAQDAVFSHALVALAAKLVVIDGMPNSAEYATFSLLFAGEPGEQANRLKTLFMKHVSDDSSALQYARQLLNTTYGQHTLHYELVERLLRLAVADAPLNAAECEWLRAVAAILQVDGEEFRTLVAHHTVAAHSPYEVLGISASASDEELRTHYMGLVQKLHPDRYQAVGATAATIAMLSDQLAAVNAAYKDICAKRAKKLHGIKTVLRNNKGARARA